MTQEVTTTTPLFVTPYITTAEYRQAPTAVDVDDLVGGGSSAVNEQELKNVVARASSLIDAYCGQVLAATQDTEQFRARISRDGMLRVHPRYWPIQVVVGGQYGSFPNELTPLDPTTCWIEQMAVVFPLQGFGTQFFGPIQFGGIYQPNMEQFVQLTYINGYANARTSITSTAGATSLAVNDVTGFLPNQQFQVYDGANTEILVVSSSWVPTTGAGSLTLKSATTADHGVGVSASALPPAIKEAAILMTNYLLKNRGTSSIVMSSLSPTQSQTSSAAGMNDLEQAHQILEPYRRIR